MPAELSGGMRKRVALARAIAAEPEVVLYDEPTTGLDPINTRRINELIRSVQERLGITSVVVTHDLASAYIVSDRIAMLDAGRIRSIEDVDGVPPLAGSGDPRVRRRHAAAGRDGGPMKPDEGPHLARMGVFLTASIALLLAAVILLGRSQTLFAHRVRLHTAFENTSGLVVGAPVRLAGVDVGIVESIRFDRDLRQKNVHVTLVVDRRYLDRIRDDSVARLAPRACSAT